MQRDKILVIVIITLLVVLTAFIVFGIVFRPPSKTTLIDPGTHGINPFCQKQRVECNVDADCNKCADNEKMKCVEIKRNSDQEKLYGKTGKFCLPEKPKQECNEKNGGIWAWTGWASNDRMEWDCLCTYPRFAGGKGCSQLNPNVCVGGNWNYDGTTATQAPSPKNCTCPQNSHLLVTKPEGVPFCVPNKDFLCTDAKMCTTMYSNTDFLS